MTSPVEPPHPAITWQANFGDHFFWESYRHLAGTYPQLLSVSPCRQTPRHGHRPSLPRAGGLDPPAGEQIPTRSRLTVMWGAPAPPRCPQLRDIAPRTFRPPKCPSALPRTPFRDRDWTRDHAQGSRRDGARIVNFHRGSHLSWPAHIPEVSRL